MRESVSVLALKSRFGAGPFRWELNYERIGVRVVFPRGSAYPADPLSGKFPVPTPIPS